MIPSAPDPSWDVKLIDLGDSNETPEAPNWKLNEPGMEASYDCDAPIDTIPSPPPEADPGSAVLTIPAPPPLGVVFPIAHPFEHHQVSTDPSNP